MDTTSFDDIRAFYDNEIPEAMQRIASDPLLEPAAKYLFPDRDFDHLREKIRSCKTTDQIQREIMYPVIKRILVSTTDSLTSSGTANAAGDYGRLFISNHRDIALDAFILQYALFSKGLPTTDIALGDNLLRPQIVADICHANNMIKIIRKDDVSPREFLENSKHLSEFMRMRISSGRSIWIAQRNGRTKDGRDATDQGLLKMIGMSGEGDFASDFEQLHITPVAISYQYEPCDVQKAQELTARMSGEPYHKRPNEDFESILCGIVSPKGNVNINICEPISVEELREFGSLPKSEAYKALTDAIDRRILEGYRLHDTNYIAHDILHGEQRYASHYTPQQEQIFRKRLAMAEELFGSDCATARDIYLGIYANPVDGKR